MLFLALHRNLYRGYHERGLHLDLDHYDGKSQDMSPPSDNVIFDNQCYATTPSSSNNNSDSEQPDKQSQYNNKIRKQKNKVFLKIT